MLTKLCFDDSRLAYNNLSGQIPGSLFQVARYKYAKFALNVCYSFNYFLDYVWVIKFHFSVSSFSGNHLNCGPNFPHSCASSMSYQSKLYADYCIFEITNA